MSGNFVFNQDSSSNILDALCAPIYMILVYMIMLSVHLYGIFEFLDEIERPMSCPVRPVVSVFYFSPTSFVHIMVGSSLCKDRRPESNLFRVVIKRNRM